MIDDDDAARIADALVARLDTLPRELKSVVHATGQYHMPLPVRDGVNYPVLKVLCDVDGIWIIFELNSYRLYERKFFYNDEYAFPRHQR